MKKTLTMALLTLTTIAAGAQQHVINAFEALKADRCATTQRISNSYDKGKQDGMLEIYRFSASDDADARPIRNLIKAFEDDSKEAYSYVFHKAGDTRQRYSVYYDRSNAEVIGDDKASNYLLLNVMDASDTSNTMRYCYVLEWQEHDDGSLTGRAIKTYAPKPSSTTRRPYAVRVGGKNWSSDSLNNLSPKRIKSMRIIKGPVDSVMVELLDSLPETLEALVDLDKLGARLSTNLDNMSDSLENNIVQLDGALKGLGKLFSNDDETALTDDVEWITSFNHYRNAFKRAAAYKRSSVASYATSILKLCKNSKQASLTDGEINLCRKSIKDLQKLTDDEFVRGLLDEAIQYLRR